MSLETIYMLRHGETDMNRELRCQGQIDIPLNETGREQVLKAADFFDNVELDAVYSSPLSRALEGAKLIAERKGLEPVVRDWLLEINHGELEGMNRAESDEKFPGLLNIWLYKPAEALFPGGEKLAEVAERVRSGMLELLDSESGTVLLVTHQIISGVARCMLMGLPIERVWEDKLVNGAHFRFDITPEQKKNLAGYRM